MAADKIENLAAACELKKEIRSIKALSASINTTRRISLGISADGVEIFSLSKWNKFNLAHWIPMMSFSAHRSHSFQIREEYKLEKSSFIYACFTACADEYVNIAAGDAT